MTAFLVVRATVAAADRKVFDHWYESEHLPQAKAGFEAVSAWRGWCEDDPGIHVALYQFTDVAHARRVMASDGLAELIAEFDREWQGRVVRERTFFGVSQEL